MPTNQLPSYPLPVHQRVVFKIAGFMNQPPGGDAPAYTLLMFVVFWRTLVVADWSSVPITCRSCLSRKRSIISAIVVSRPLVAGCGMIFHRDCGGRDCHLIPSDDLWKLTSLATEAPSDSSKFIGAAKNKLIYLRSLVLTAVTVVSARRVQIIRSSQQTDNDASSSSLSLL